jgi:DHA3 family tetracycline resistance protein-like MFS transporter
VRILVPFRIRDFALLWTAMTVSLLGDGIYFVAIAWQVYEISDAPTALSIVGVAWTLPNVLLILVGGVLSDRFDRRSLMIVSDLVRGVAIGAIAVLSIAGTLELWHLLVLVAIYGAGEALFAPAFQAIVPDIVPTEHLVQANSLDMLMRPLGAQLVGPAFGGLAVAAFGTGVAFAIDAATFGISAICLLLMGRRPLPLREDPISVRGALADIAEGFRFARSERWLWTSLLAAALSLLLFFGPAQVLLPYVIKHDLSGGSGDYGLALAFVGVGSVAAAIVIGQRQLPRRPIAVMYGSWVTAMICVTLWGLAGGVWQILAISVVRGVGISVGLVVWMTLMHTRIPRQLLGRVSSVDWMLSMSLIPVSYALTGPVAEAFGARETLVAAGVLGAAVIGLAPFVFGLFREERRLSGAYDPVRGV